MMNLRRLWKSNTMDTAIKAVIVILIVAALAYTLIYVVPALTTVPLSKVTYSSSYAVKPTVILNLEAPSEEHVESYNGSQVEVKSVVTYIPLVPKPSVNMKWCRQIARSTYM